jgi:UDP-glucose 4-epimerase
MLPSSRVVAVTGACTYLGTELLRGLEEDPSCQRILALDVRPPALGGASSKIEHIKIDLTQPTVDGELATLMQNRKVDTFVHGAFLSHPTHASEWAHELEDVGTMHVLNACAAVPPRRVVAISSTLVYGAHPNNPNYLDENCELRGHRDSRFVNDKVRAEKQIAVFAAEHPSVEVCTLRFAPILGPTVNNLHTRFFSRLVAPVMMGHDPLMQFVHEQDASWALRRAINSRATGAFNIIGKGVLPYTTVLALLGRVPMPMPYMVARQMSKALWATQLVGSPPSFLDFLLYLCVADGERAKRELGYAPRLSIKRTILDFLGVAPHDGATDIARAHG